MWGWIPWQEASLLPGATQLGLAAQYLRSIHWNGFTPANDSMKVNADLDHPYRPWAGKSGNNLIAYFPPVSMAPAEMGISFELATIVFQKLEKNSPYSMEIINPRNGKVVRSEKIMSTTDGEWHFKSTNIASPLPTMEDWIVSLKLLA